MADRAGVAVDLRRRRLTIAALAGLTFGGCEAPPPAGPRAGDRLPELGMSRLDGPEASLAEFAGKALVLNLWATWCKPCRAEMPSLQRLADAFPLREMAVVALSVDDDLNLVREFLLRHAIRFPVFADTRRPSVRSVLGIKAYPTTLLVRRDGRIAEVVAGERDWGSAEMLARISALLDVRPGAPAAL